MTNTRRSRGFSRERELVRTLWKHGFAVMRAPASGAKSRRVKYPDIVAMKNGHIFVIEVKTKDKPGHIYIEKHQIDKVREFSERAGGKGFIAVKIMDGRGWRFIPLEKLVETPGGNYKVPLEELDNALDLKGFIKLADSSRKITEWI
ncbi:Holliday junction resolvase [Desulfurococcaceae archaeon MEX13E-LK6-19]|nr:Holliday junction resolvase [Desulfurococcaceae archaeon MEX13E-LK6-19]